MRKSSLLAAILALAFVPALHAQSLSGRLEALKRGGQASLLKTAHAMPDLRGLSLAAPVYEPSAPEIRRRGEGTRMALSVSQIFDDQYEARQFPGVDLRVARRNHFPGGLSRYEATGEFFGQRLTFGSPLVIENDAFGSRRTVTMRGAGMDLKFERLVGWGQMEVEASFDAGVKPEAVAVLHGLAAFLPDVSPSAFADETGLRTAEQNPVSRRGFYRFQERSRDDIDVTGAGVNLQIRVRDTGFEDHEYEVTGSAFGQRLGFGDLVLKTDKNFLGLRGYRAQGLGVDLEVDEDVFGGRRTVDVRGSAGRSSEVSALLLALAQYIRTR